MEKKKSKKDLKILVIPDKFKFSYNSIQIAEILAQSLKNQGYINVSKIPISDGGDGFLKVVNSVLDLRYVKHEIFDARLQKQNGKFAIYNKTAFLESAETIGLERLQPELRNPLLATSYGLGKQILSAIENKVDKIVVGLGGSATSDGGIGMAAALGYEFLDCRDNKLEPFAFNLNKICRIIDNADDILQNIEFIGLSDVKNPLFGKNGAAFSFAAQKGANYEQIVDLDKGLKNLKDIYIEKFGGDPRCEDFEGSAGGLGFALKYFLDAELKSGSEYILDLLNIENKIKLADVVITGEGKFDEQSFNGKIVGEIYNIAKKNKKQTIVVTGFSSVSKKIDNLSIVSLFKNKTKVNTAKLLTPKIINEIDFSNFISF